MTFDFDPMAPDATLAACEAAITAQIGAREMTSAALARRRAIDDVALVDLRAPDEQAVSMIPGAVAVADHMGPEAIGRVLAGLDRTPRCIVVYCAVGLRSARLVARWAATGGAADVHSLRGGIFRWFGEGRPVTGRPPFAVHPFDARWGRLLPIERRRGAGPSSA